jgi:hypothetical protein
MAQTRGKKPRTPRKFRKEQAQSAGADTPAPAPAPAAVPEMDYQAIIKSHKLKQVIVNPKSKFVVCTYWWGRGNANKNYLRFGDETTDQAIKDGKRVNYACTGEFIEQIKEEIIEEIREEEEEEQAIEKAIADGMFDEEREFYEISKERRIAILKKYPLKYDRKKVDSILARPDIQKRVSEGMKQNEIRMKAEGKVKHEATKFEDMIDTWINMCKSVGCNYIVEEYPEFAFPGKYQLAINLKPLFIKEALLTAGAQGRGVLYIDGDMTIKRYPDLFDMPSVDFMARGWNVDPRGSMNYLRDDVCFDPYIFETSGGTMYFAPTRQAILLLKQWAKVSAQPDMQGKADDRILSMVFTTGRQNEAISSIQLPIEYLWLNDAYDFQKKEDVMQDRIYIEHPACLTAEETAREQGASASREPPKYEEVVTDMIDCAQPGGVFYEYVFFTERRFVESFEPYLNYLRRAKTNKGEPFYKIVGFEEHYGRYNKVAYKNMEKSNAIDVKTLPAPEMLAKLPQDTTIPMIIACFKNGNDVLIGDYQGEYSATYDLMAENIGDQHLTPYQRKIKLDVTKPIYMSGLNPVLIHLLMMCETLEDINQHYHESFMFASRIRAWWTKTDRV